MLTHKPLLKKPFVLIALFLLLLGASLYFLRGNPQIVEFFSIDKCLDKGGAWNSVNNECDMGASEFADDKIIRGDGDEFSGLAVFATWDSTEPARFPLLFDGEVSGVWFFEATFPVFIVLADGTVVGEGYAQAQGDWMTTDVVPFYAVVEKRANAPEYVGQAALVLRRNNASGLPENDAQFTTPVFIDTTN